MKFVIHQERIDKEEMTPYYCLTSANARTCAKELLALPVTKCIHINEAVVCFDGYLTNGNYIHTIMKENWNNKTAEAKARTLKTFIK